MQRFKTHALKGIYTANIHRDNAYFEVFGSVSFIFYYLPVVPMRKINIKGFTVNARLPTARL